MDESTRCCFFLNAFHSLNSTKEVNCLVQCIVSCQHGATFLYMNAITYAISPHWIADDGLAQPFKKGSCHNSPTCLDWRLLGPSPEYKDSYNLIMKSQSKVQNYGSRRMKQKHTCLCDIPRHISAESLNPMNHLSACAIHMAANSDHALADAGRLLLRKT